MTPLKSVAIAHADYEVAVARLLDRVRKVTDPLNGDVAQEQVVVHVPALLPARTHESLAFRSLGHVLGDLDGIEFRRTVEPARSESDLIVRIAVACPIPESDFGRLRIVISPARSQEPLATLKMNAKNMLLQLKHAELAYEGLEAILRNAPKVVVAQAWFGRPAALHIEFCVWESLLPVPSSLENNPEDDLRVGIQVDGLFEDVGRDSDTVIDS